MWFGEEPIVIGYFNGYVLYPFLERVTKRQIAPKLVSLKRFEVLPAFQRQEIQRVAAHKLVEFCKAEIPYYQDLFKTQGFDVERVKTDIRYLQELPLLTKEIVKEQGERLKAKSRGVLQHRKTGGSTGQSVFFYYDNEGLDWTAAINLLAYEMAGKKPHHKDFHISADIDFGKPPLKHRLVDFVKLFSQNRQRLMVSSFENNLLEKVYSKLKSRKPFLVQGHPSSMYAIADYVERNDIKPAQVCFVFEPSGEMMTPKMVESIERNLMCKVVNRYGNAEFGVVAHSEQGGSYTKLRVFESAFFVETGTQSSIVATALTNFGFPLIRYDTGDVADVLNEDGRTYICNIQGRIHDTVNIGGETFPTHYIMDYLDHRIGGVREFQIVFEQNSIEPLLCVVVENPVDEGRIQSEIFKRWSKGLRVKFIKYEELQRVGWRQKFRHIIDLRVK